MNEKENRLFEIFKRSGVIKGKFRPDVPMKKKIQMALLKELEELKRLSPKTAGERKRQQQLVPKLFAAKQIDAICKTKECTWVFEVEEELRPMAIGQVIEYGYLYSIGYPKESVRLGVVCGKVKDIKFAKYLQEKYMIETFLVDVKQGHISWIG